MRISLNNNLKLAITPNPLGLKYHAIDRFVSFLKNLSLVQQKIKNRQWFFFIFLLASKLLMQKWNINTPWCCRVIAFLCSLIQSTFSIIEHMFWEIPSSQLSLETCFYLWSQTIVKVVISTVCETNPLKNDKYQKLERGPYPVWFSIFCSICVPNLVLLTPNPQFAWNLTEICWTKVWQKINDSGTGFLE